jgi:transposase-like protein
LVAIACEEQGKGIGRIRLRRLEDASADSLQAFISDSIEPGSEIHTDGWEGYTGLEALGYRHRVTVLRGRRKGSPIELLPRVRLVASLLKRWLLGTHQGAVSFAYLEYYLDEFTFRFNRRTSRSRGQLFQRLMEQAVAVDPVPYKKLVQAGETWWRPVRPSHGTIRA